MESFIGWIGGKKLLRKRILEQFPDHYARYVEVFGGAGWVLFAEERKVDLEVYNDVNGGLVNLFRCVKYHPEALQKELDGMIMSRELFAESIQKDPMGLTDIQRAARMFYAIKESYGTDCKSFGAKVRDLKKAVDFMGFASERLKKVVIERADFGQILRTYDREGALFYLDPPYYKTEKYYPDRFMPEDHERLRKALGRIKGKFLPSYNDCKEIKELYERYQIVEVERSNNLGVRAGNKRYKELIIKNY